MGVLVFIDGGWGRRAQVDLLCDEFKFIHTGKTKDLENKPSQERSAYVCVFCMTFNSDSTEQASRKGGDVRTFGSIDHQADPTRKVLN